MRATTFAFANIYGLIMSGKVQTTHLYSNIEHIQKKFLSRESLWIFIPSIHFSSLGYC